MEVAIAGMTGEFWNGYAQLKKFCKNNNEEISFILDRDIIKHEANIDDVDIVSYEKMSEFNGNRIYIFSHIPGTIIAIYSEIERMKADEYEYYVCCREKDIDLELRRCIEMMPHMNFWVFKEEHDNNIKFTVKIHPKSEKEIVFDVIDESDWCVFREIYFNKVYNISCPEHTVLIDIGGNIGCASLYFAQYDEVERIYTYEPFYENYIRIKKNLERSSSGLTSKIEVRHIALSDKNGYTKVAYNNEWCGGNSIVGCKIEEGVRHLNVKEQAVRRASEEIKDILEKEIDKNIVIKCDCEGSEFSIMNDLDRNKLLPYIHSIIMEIHPDCHMDNGKEIEIVLKKSGFDYLSTRNTNGQLGMIFAVNTHK